MWLSICFTGTWNLTWQKSPQQSSMLCTGTEICDRKSFFMKTDKHGVCDKTSRALNPKKSACCYSDLCSASDPYFSWVWLYMWQETFSFPKKSLWDIILRTIMLKQTDAGSFHEKFDVVQVWFSPIRPPLLLLLLRSGVSESCRRLPCWPWPCQSMTLQPSHLRQSCTLLPFHHPLWPERLEKEIFGESFLIWSSHV